MKSKLFATLLAAAVITANAQTVKLPTENFNGIELSGSQDVFLQQGTENNITIEGDADAAIALKPTISNGVLKLEYDKKNPLKKNAKIIINFKNIDNLTVSGTSNIKGENEFTLTDFTVNSSGSTDMKLNIKANKVIAEISGAGDLLINGAAKELIATIRGAGDFDAKDFVCNKVIVNASGAGDAKVNATEELSGNCSGAGSVKFKGNPTNVKITQTGAGSVMPYDDKNVDINIQFNDGKHDTTRIHIGKKKIIIIGDDKEESKVESNEYPNPDRKIEKEIIIKKKDKKQIKNIWQGLEIGVNGYANAAPSLGLQSNYSYLDLNYGKSIMVNLNPVERHIKIYKEYVAFTTGLGLQFNRFAFAHDTQLNSNTDSVFAVATKIDYSKNLLRTTFLTLPLLLEFNTNSNPNKSFHIAVGALLGYKLGKAKLKQRYEINNSQIAIQMKNSFNINDFQYGLTGRIGYGKINLFATYHLSTLFKQNKTLAVNPFSIGLTIIPFD